MAKDKKITVQYPDDPRSENVKKLLETADETDWRILSSVFLLSGERRLPIDASDLTDLLKLERSEVDASVKFWRGGGILTWAAEGEVRKASSPSTAADAPARVTAHRNGVVERSSTLGGYSSEELAELMESGRISPDLIDEAQKIMGKMFRVYDMEILVGMVDRLGFEEAAVLAVLQYTVQKGKKTLRYAEKLAMSFYDDGITETSAVLEEIHRIEQASEMVGKIKTLFGFGSRALTESEKKLFRMWTETFKYDMDVIRLAYEITVDNIQKPAPKYTGSILERWYKEGLKNADEVMGYLEAQKKKKENPDSDHTPKSYDLDEFFEAALQRGLKELQ